METRERREVKWIHRYVLSFSKTFESCKKVIHVAADSLATFVASLVLIVSWESANYYIYSSYHLNAHS